MTTAEVLYRDLLEGFELREQLRSELELEQDYRDHVLGLVRSVAGDEVAAQYTSAWSHCGGRNASTEVLPTLLKSLQVKAGGSRSVYCGIWPRGELGARTLKQGNTAVIVLDVGLWFNLRFACQQTALALARITGAPQIWGDDDPSDDPGDVLRQHLRSYIEGETAMRDSTRLTVLRGPREAFRRSLNTAALLYITAHEYAHATSSDTELSTVVWSDSAELASQALENEADRFAADVLRKSAIVDSPLAAALAPLLVLHVLGFALRTEQTAGRDPINWTHMAPELRAYFMQTFMTENSDKLANVAERFRNWLWTSLDYQNLFTQAGRTMS